MGAERQAEPSHIAKRDDTPSRKSEGEWVSGVSSLAEAASALEVAPPPHRTARSLRQDAVVQLQATVGNRHVARQLAQRQADTSAVGQPAPAAATPSAGANGPAAATGPLIVEDAATPGSGQLTKTAFLAALRSDVTTAAEAALAGTGRTTADCPYLNNWFEYYSAQSAERVDRAVRKYAPEAAQATTAQDYIPAVSRRVERGVRAWATTGEMTGIPDDLPAGLPGVSLLQRVGGLLSGVAGAASRIAGPFLKAREGGGQATHRPEAVQAQLGAGRGLEGGVRSRMEGAFGHGFSDVQIHTDGAAAGLSSQMNARAFTVGANVAFGAGEYRPGTPIGDALIAHELAHVVQQRGASASGGVMHKGGSASSALEEDADRSAVDVAASLWGGVTGGLQRMGQNALPSLKSGLRLQRCSFAQAPADLTTAEAKAKWITKAMQEDKAGTSKEIVKVFKTSQSPGDFLDIQKNLDMPAVLDYLELWDAVQIGALGPVVNGEDKLNAKRTEFIGDAVHLYGINRAQVFTHFIFGTMYGDDIKKVLSLLAAEAKLKSSILQMESVKALIKQRGIDLSEFKDRSEGIGDAARGLGRGLKDLLTPPIKKEALGQEYMFRSLDLPQEYQDILRKVEMAEFEGSLTPGNVILGALDQLTFGLSSAAYGLVAGTISGVGNLAKGNLDQGMYELTGATVAVLTFLGVKAYQKLAAGPTLKGPAGPGQFVIKGFKGAITKEEAMLGAVLQLNPEAQAAAGLLFSRIGKQGVKDVARYIQADKRAAVLVHEHGLPAVEALQKAKGDVAKARAMLPAAGEVPALPAAAAAAAEPRAILPNGKSIPPDDYAGGYHGTDKVAPSEALKNGLPAGGTNWNLQEHAEGKPGSAYRGTTTVVSDPVNEGGAAYWAGEGGWVYDVRGVPTWDVNKALEGRVQTPGGFRGNLMRGENERAIPARVPPENIKRYGQVVSDSQGRLLVRDWQDNPNFKSAKKE